MEFLRVTRELTWPKPQPPKGQNKKDPVKMPGSVKHRGYYSCKGIVKIPGPPVIIHTGSLSCSPPLSVPPTSEKLCPQISQILRSCSPCRLGVPPRGIVVERQSCSMEWESPVPTDLIIETDASRQGWGAYCQGMLTGGRWLPEETSYHINC